MITSPPQTPSSSRNLSSPPTARCLPPTHSSKMMNRRLLRAETSHGLPQFHQFRRTNLCSDNPMSWPLEQWISPKPGIVIPYSRHGPIPPCTMDTRYIPPNMVFTTRRAGPVKCMARGFPHSRNRAYFRDVGIIRSEPLRVASSTQQVVPSHWVYLDRDRFRCDEPCRREWPG